MTGDGIHFYCQTRNQAHAFQKSQKLSAILKLKFKKIRICFEIFIFFSKAFIPFLLCVIAQKKNEAKIDCFQWLPFLELLTDGAKISGVLNSGVSAIKFHIQIVISQQR